MFANESGPVDFTVREKGVDGAGHVVLGYAKELRALVSSTEGDFLSVGARLDAVLSQARTISESALMVIKLIRSEEVARDIERLQELFDTTGEYFHQSQRRLERSTGPLLQMKEMVKRAHGPLSVFEGMVKRLRMLAISTRIENARLIDNDSGFDVVAEDVKKLSGVIASKSEGIRTGIMSLHEAVERTLAKILMCRQLIERHTRTMLESLTANISMVCGKRVSSSEAASVLAARSEEITAHVSEIISSLQFHDIARQQIEHVTDMLETVQAESAGDDPNRAALQAMAGVGELQADQLTHARDELMSAVARIKEALEGVASRLSDMSNEAVRLIRVAGMKETSFLSEMNHSLSLITVSFAENEETDRQLAQAVSSVAGTIEELSAFVSDIEEIGSEIEVIARNAQVKAAHRAKDGGALGVLAGAIKNLSDSAGSQALIMIDTLRGIGHAAVELDTIGDEERKSGYGTDGIEEDVKGLLESLGRADERVVSLLDDLNKNTEKLIVEIETAVNGVSAVARADEVITVVMGGLRHLAASGRSGTPHGAADTANRHLEELASRYTMHQERLVHQSHVAGGFGKTAQQNDTYLGENVELF
jgi:methyl-accepting chemotaxis protein